MGGLLCQCVCVCVVSVPGGGGGGLFCSGRVIMQVCVVVFVLLSVYIVVSVPRMLFCRGSAIL